VDPEEPLAGDEVEGLIERHNLGAEGTWVAPSITPPPQDLDVVALAGGRSRATGAPVRRL